MKNSCFLNRVLFKILGYILLLGGNQQAAAEINMLNLNQPFLFVAIAAVDEIDLHSPFVVLIERKTPDHNEISLRIFNFKGELLFTNDNLSLHRTNQNTIRNGVSDDDNPINPLEDFEFRLSPWNNQILVKFRKAGGPEFSPLLKLSLEISPPQIKVGSRNPEIIKFEANIVRAEVGRFRSLKLIAGILPGKKYGIYPIDGEVERENEKTDPLLLIVEQQEFNFPHRDFKISLWSRLGVKLLKRILSPSHDGLVFKDNAWFYQLADNNTVLNIGLNGLVEGGGRILQAYPRDLQETELRGNKTSYFLHNFSFKGISLWTELREFLNLRTYFFNTQNTPSRPLMFPSGVRGGTEYPREGSIGNPSSSVNPGGSGGTGATGNPFGKQLIKNCIRLGFFNYN